jgi:hypothetical protein
LTLQFLATVDSQKEARDISLGFLPYSLLASFVLSLIASYLYARMISAPILEIKQMTKRMKRWIGQLVSPFIRRMRSAFSSNRSTTSIIIF